MNATTTERNEITSSRNARISTKAKTHGVRSLTSSSNAIDIAVPPVTTAVTPSSPPRVDGTTSSASVVRASREACSSPSPTSGTDTTATVPASLVSTVIGSFISPLASAPARRSAMAACTSGAVTSSASMTTSAGSEPPGNASAIRS